MPRKKKRLTVASDAGNWLKKAVQSSPRPLPAGYFPKLLAEAGRDGYSRDEIMDVLDDWLNFGYCKITDHLSQDIEITLSGELFFYG